MASKTSEPGPDTGPDAVAVVTMPVNPATSLDDGATGIVQNIHDANGAPSGTINTVTSSDGKSVTTVLVQTGQQPTIVHDNNPNKTTGSTHTLKNADGSSAGTVAILTNSAGTETTNTTKISLTGQRSDIVFNDVNSTTASAKTPLGNPTNDPTRKTDGSPRIDSSADHTKGALWTNEMFNGHPASPECCDLRKIECAGSCVHCATCAAGTCCNSIMRGCANTNDEANPNTLTKGLCGMAFNIAACGMCLPCGCFGCCCIEGSWPLAGEKQTHYPVVEETGMSIGFHIAILVLAILTTLYSLYYIFVPSSKTTNTIQTIEPVEPVIQMRPLQSQFRIPR